jgi:beta-lactamase class C
MTALRPIRGWKVFAIITALMAVAGAGRALVSHHDTPRAMAQPARHRAAILSGVQDKRPHRIDYVRFDKRLQEVAAAPDMVGMGVAVIEDGQLTFVKGYGKTTVGGTPVEPSTVFRWASLSKGVAATVVAELASERRLSLEDPVGRYARSLRLPGGTERTATITDLLSHRLGLVRNAYDDKLEEGLDPHAIRTMLGTLHPACAPGTCHNYQNVAYDAASEIVETVTHQRYAQAVQQRIFTPLGMENASVTRAGLVNASSWARPHRGTRELPVQQAYYNAPAAGGVNSSIFDLALWMRAQMGLAPAVVPANVIQTIHTPLVETDRSRPRHSPYDRAMSDAWYGMGWREYHYLGHRLVGHRGAVSGYRSLILFDPDAKTGIAMLWNSESARPVGAQVELLDAYYGVPFTDWMGLAKPEKAPHLAKRETRHEERLAVVDNRGGRSRSAR